jgi:predicted nucleic acid-binding protein
MEIIDASVILKWFIDEEPDATDKARKIRDGYLKGLKQLYVPDFIYVEIANMLVFYKKISDSQIETIWSKLKQFNLPSIPIGLEFLSKSLKISRKYGISVYDAIYVNLAIEKECQLITADKKLVKAVNEPFVRLL